MISDLTLRHIVPAKGTDNKADVTRVRFGAVARKSRTSHLVVRTWSVSLFLVSLNNH